TRDHAVDAIGADDELSGEGTTIHAAHQDTSGRPLDTGHPRRLAHRGARRACTLEQRGIELGATQGQVERLLSRREDSVAGRRLHAHAPDLVDIDFRPQVLPERGEAAIDTVADAAAAGLVAREA